MATKDIRDAIVAAIGAVLPAGWTVYAAPPPGTPAAPAAVVGPRPPYRRLETFSRYRIGLRVSLFVPVALGQDALDALDDVLDVVLPALWAIESLGIDQVDQVGVSEGENGGAYIAAAVDLWMVNA